MNVAESATPVTRPVPLWRVVDVTAPPERLATLRILTGLFALAYLVVRLPVFVQLTERESGFDGVGAAALLDAPVPDAVIVATIVVTIASGAAYTLGWRFRSLGPVFAVGFRSLATVAGGGVSLGVVLLERLGWAGVLVVAAGAALVAAGWRVALVVVAAILSMKAIGMVSAASSGHAGELKSHGLWYTGGVMVSCQPCPIREVSTSLRSAIRRSNHSELGPTTPSQNRSTYAERGSKPCSSITGSSHATTSTTMH